MVNKEDPALALLALRTTPGKYNTTPAQKLMGRTLRTNLPSIKPPLKTSRPTTMSKTTTAHYNDSAQNLPVLHPGDNVRLRDGRNWSREGTVVVTDQNPRSYHVRTETGNVLRRNRRHLIKIKQAPPSKPSKPSSATADLPPINSPTTRTTRYGRHLIKIKQAPPSKPSKPSSATADPPPVNSPTTRTTRYGLKIRPPQYWY